MNKLAQEIKNIRKKVPIYQIVRIDLYANGGGCLYVLHTDEDQKPFYINSTSHFGEWLMRERVKVNDIIRLKLSQGCEVEFAEIIS